MIKHNPELCTNCFYMHVLHNYYSFEYSIFVENNPASFPDYRLFP